MTCSFIKTDWESLLPMPEMYHAYLGWQNCAFHNHFMFDYQAYEIVIGCARAGFLSAMELSSSVMLSGFYLHPQYRSVAAEILNELEAQLTLFAVMIPDHDSLLTDCMAEKRNSAKRSFFPAVRVFVYHEPVRSPEFGIETLEEISPAEYETAGRLTENAGLIVQGLGRLIRNYTCNILNIEVS